MLTCTHLLTKSLIYECYMSYLNASILLAISAIYKKYKSTFFPLFSSDPVANNS